jgi:hypothetical protein
VPEQPTDRGPETAVPKNQNDRKNRQTSMKQIVIGGNTSSAESDPHKPANAYVQVGRYASI